MVSEYRPGNPKGLVRAFSDTVQFFRDILWLIGWAIRRVGTLGKETSPESSWRGRCGCLAGGMAVLLAALFWRGRKQL